MCKAPHLLPHVDLLFVIVVVDQNRAIRRRETDLFRSAVFMKYNKSAAVIHRKVATTLP